jgi:hypothetical protein
VVGDEVLKLVPSPAKLEPRATTGAHCIETVHTNGTVTTIRLDNNIIISLNEYSYVVSSLIRGDIESFHPIHSRFLSFMLNYVSCQ